MIELSLLAAFMVGLLGGGHCVGMCGGIVGAVTISLPGSKPRLGFVLTYNLGRVLSYTIAGALAGAVGASSFFLAHILPVQNVLYALSSIMLILLGLYLAGIWAGVTQLERVGGLFWRKLQPYSRRFIPVQNLRQSLMVGAIWGWLPCGLVYSVLIAAIATANPVQGATLMLCFGLGTLPTLLAMGLAAVKLKSMLQLRWVRTASGWVVIVFGVVGLSRVFMH